MMHLKKKFRALGISAILMSAWAPGFAQKQPHDFLESVGGFSDSDLTVLDNGDVITKILDTGINNELALMGAARMQGTIDGFLELYRDIERFEGELGPVNKLSKPPTLADLNALVFDKGDLKSLERCKVGDCDINIGAQALEQLHQKIDWSDPGANAAVTRFLHEEILNYVVAYETGGNEALAVYHNKSHPESISKDFTALLERSPYVLQYEPELHQYLLDYPKATLPRSSDFFYWSVLGFGPKPTLRVNHVTIYPTQDGANATTIIASKQLYFSHYFDTGLELYTVFPGAQSSGDGFYLVALNRYRTDLGGGLTGKVMRMGAASGTEKAMRDTIKNAQAMMAK